MVYGLWFMVYGLWCMVYGFWYMVWGLVMVYGVGLVRRVRFRPRRDLVEGLRVRGLDLVQGLRVRG